MKENKPTMRKRFSLRASVVAAALVGAALINAPMNAEAASNKNLVGFVAVDASHNPFAVSLAEGAIAEAKKLGVNLSYVDAKTDVSKAIAAIQTNIARGAKAIVVFPSDPKALVPILNKAAAKGIKIISVNNSLDPSAKVLTAISADNYSYGVAEGQLVAKALNNKGTVAIATGIPAVQAAVDRTKGITDTLSKIAGIKIVATQADNWNPETMLKLTQDWLGQYSDLGAIVVEGPEGTVAGTWAAAHNRPDLKVIVGDYPKEVENAIKAGTVYGAVNQDPVTQAQIAIQIAKKVIDGKTKGIKPVILSPLPLITSENVAKTPATW